MSECKSIDGVRLELANVGVSGLSNPVRQIPDWEQEIYAACFPKQPDPHALEPLEDRMCCGGDDCKHVGPAGEHVCDEDHDHDVDQGLKVRLQGAFTAWMAEPTSEAQDGVEPAVKKRRVGNIVPKARSLQWRSVIKFNF